MADLTDFNTALSAVSDRQTSSAGLDAIARDHPQLRHLVAGHPNASDELLAWLDGLGDPNVSLVVARRQAVQARQAASAPVPAMPVAVPADAESQPVSVVPVAAEGMPSTVKRRRNVWTALAAVVGLALVVTAVIYANRSLPAPGVASPTVVVEPAPPEIIGGPELVWSKDFGGTGHSEFEAVAVAPDGSIIAVGKTDSKNGEFPRRHAGQDALIVKFSSGGEIVWAKTMGGAGKDAFHAVAVAADGSIFAAGDTSSVKGDFPMRHGGKSDAVVVKLAGDGAIVWSKTYGGSGDDTFSSLAMLADGDMVVAGSTTSPNGDVPVSHGGCDAMAATLSGDGSIVWSKTYGGSGNDSFSSVAPSPDGSLVVVGQSDSPDGDFPSLHQAANAVIAQLSADGALSWGFAYGGSGGDQFNGVVLTPSSQDWQGLGSVIAVGSSSSADGDFAAYRAGGMGASTGNPQVGIHCLFAGTGTRTMPNCGGFTVTGKATYNSVAVMPSGTVVMVGTSQFLPGGTPEAEFATDIQTPTMGAVTEAGSDALSSVTAVVPAPDGTAVAVGYHISGKDTKASLAVISV